MIRGFFYLFSFVLVSYNVFSSVIPLDKPVGVFIKNIAGGDENARRGGELIYEAYEPNHINPITFNQSGSIEVLVNWIFETLLDTDIVTGDDIPRLAKAWAVSKDGKEFTFWLDERAKWFDGKPVTAEDVKFSFEVFSMPGVNAALRKVQASAFSRIEIISPQIIKFSANTRLFSNFEFIISTLILPRHLYYHTDPKKIASNQFTRNPRGSGPYIVESWQKGNRAILIRNKNYWGMDLLQNKGAYNFDRIIIRYIRDHQMAFERLKRGDLDYMPIRIGNTELWAQTTRDKAFLSGKIRALKVHSKLQQGYGFVGFNLNNEMFSDKNVRLALGKAINREEMIEKTLSSLATIPRGPLYSVDNFDGTFKPLNYDPKEALKLLEKAGWKDRDGDYILDKDGKPFSFTVIVPNSRIEKEMLYIQNYWKQIGVNATVKILEYSTWKQLQDQRKFDAVSNGKTRSLNARGVDPYGEWHSDNLAHGLRNYYGYKNPVVDNLIIQGRSEFDLRKRKKIFDKVNDIIAKEGVLFQFSESKYSLHGINSKIVLPKYKDSDWFPYSLGMKYWYKQ